MLGLYCDLSFENRTAMIRSASFQFQQGLWPFPDQNEDPSVSQKVNKKGDTSQSQTSDEDEDDGDDDDDDDLFVNTNRPQVPMLKNVFAFVSVAHAE
jgi:hypothetical protein